MVSYFFFIRKLIGNLPVLKDNFLHIAVLKGLKDSEDAEVIMDFEWVRYLTVFVSVIQ